MIYLVSNTKIKSPNVKHLRLCDIVFNKFTLDSYDFFIFTSKNGVKSLKINNLKPNLNTKVFVIGKATFEACVDFGFKNIYLSKSPYGDDFANEISVLLDGKIAFIAAKENVSNLYNILLKNGKNINKIIAYQNTICNENLPQKPPKNSVVIFTSPINVKAFESKFGNEFIAVAIGLQTYKALENFDKKFISPKPYIDICIEFAKNLQTF